MVEQDECFCWCHGHEPEPSEEEPVSHCAACEPAAARLVEDVDGEIPRVTSPLLSVADGK